MKSLNYILIFLFISGSFSYSQTPGTLKWEFQTGSGVSSPAIGADGTVFINSQDGKFYALNPDGTGKWIFESAGYGKTSPSIDSDGTVYFSSNFHNNGNYCKHYAFNPDGTMKWIFETDGEIWSSPAIGTDGTVYIESNRGLLAIKPDGTKKWEFLAGSDLTGPIIGSDGTIYAVSNNGELYAINPDGTKKWESQTGYWAAPPALSNEGILYVSSMDKISAFNPDGSRKWEFQNGNSFSPVAIDSDGIIYSGIGPYYGGYGALYALNPDGSKKWEFETDNGIYSSPAIGSEGTIYIGSSDSTLYAINPDGTKKWESPISSNFRSSPAIASDGTIYIGCDDGKLYAVYSESVGLADSPWPKFRKNNQNTANSFNKNCPVARVVDDYIFTNTGGDVTLDGSPSYDPDGEILDYLWRIIEKPQGSLISLSDSTSAVITVNIPQNIRTAYRFSLTVTDNDDGYSTTVVIVSTTRKWELQTSGDIRSSPAINPDSVIYVTSQKKLHAINPDGNIKWDFQTGYFLSSPAIASDSTIYICSNTNSSGSFYDGTLCSINPDGSIKWTFQVSGSIGGNPAVGSDGTVYIGSYYGRCYAINSDGTIKWEFLTGCHSGSPVIGPDGTIYLSPLGGGNFIAVNPDGTKKWELDIVRSNGASPAISSDGTIYLSGEEYDPYTPWHGLKLLYALNPEGTIKWRFHSANTDKYHSPVIGLDGTIYVGTKSPRNSGILYAINPDGSEKWSFNTFGTIEASPAIGSDGTIFFGSLAGEIYAVNPDGTKKWDIQDIGNVASSPAIASDGTVYIGSDDGILYALYSECAGLADSPWPKFRKDNQNTADNFNENCPQARVVEDFISIKNGGDFTLDGTPSFDPDGETLSYLWRVVEAPIAYPIVLTDSTSAVIMENIPEDIRATYRFTLTVTDNDDGSSTANVVVTTEKKWSFQTGRSIGSSPAISSDGTIYINSGDGNLYAINPNGTKKWEIHLGTDIDSSPSIDSYGTIYVGGYHSLFAINPEGTITWSSLTGGIQSSPAIGSGGTIYAGSGRILYAFNPNGTKKWEFHLKPPNQILSSSAVGYDSTIYVGSIKGLIVINPDGSKKWEFESYTAVYSSPAIGSDGTVYFGCGNDANGKFYALNPNGTKKWEYDSGGMNFASPAIDTDGTIYIAKYAFNPDGTLKWQNNSNLGSPAIGSDSTIYICSWSKISAIGSDGIMKWDFFTGSGYNQSSPAIASDGTVFIGSSDGKLHALYSNSAGLADSPWPKFMHDNRNSGNVNSPITSIKHNKELIPKKYTFSPLYPNPFNPVTHIKFSLPKPDKVKIHIYNVLGQLVIKLIEENKKAGTYDISWDASNLGTGMYFVRIESDNFVKTRKCLLIK